MPILVSPLICTKMSPGIRAWLLIVVGGRGRRIVVGIECDRIVDEMGSGHINRVRAVTGLGKNNIGSGSSFELKIQPRCCSWVSGLAS